MAIDENKQKALAAALGQIEKQFGKGSIMRLGEDRSMDVETISTGSLSLDIALGAGGLPMGRIVEIYGPESSGKTTLTLQVIAAAQREGKTCAFIDAEHALDPIYARKLGVDIDNLLCSQPDTGEQALEICDALARSGAVDVIVVDSVAALTPKAEIEGEIGDSHMGLAARMMSQAMRKLAGNLKQSNTLLIFINQIDPVDAIGSVANYFKAHGWVKGDQVAVMANGQAPGLPNGFKTKYSISQLAAAGLTPQQPLGNHQQASLLRLDVGTGYQYWYGLPNFYTITRYNHSTHYAMAVWQLGQAVALARVQ